MLTITSTQAPVNQVDTRYATSRLKSGVILSGFFGGFSSLAGYLFGTIHPIGGAAFGVGIILTSFLGNTITDLLPINEERTQTAIKTTLFVLGLLIIPTAIASLIGFPLTAAGAAKHSLAIVGTLMLAALLELFLIRYEAVPYSERPFFLRW